MKERVLKYMQDFGKRLYLEVCEYNIKNIK